MIIIHHTVNGQIIFSTVLQVITGDIYKPSVIVNWKAYAYHKIIICMAIHFNT